MNIIVVTPLEIQHCYHGDARNAVKWLAYIARGDPYGLAAHTRSWGSGRMEALDRPHHPEAMPGGQEASKEEDDMAQKHHPLIDKATKLIHEKFTKEELIELGDVLDGDSGVQMMDAINEYLMEDSPEVFGVPQTKNKTPPEARTAEAANDPRDS